MRDALVVIGVLAFFSLGAAYIVACARILTSTGNIDEPLDDDGDDEDEDAAEPKIASDAGELVQQ
ncbi:MAG TPA: hypothetical protein VID94_17420 [Acidimicrobiales bacterium]